MIHFRHKWSKWSEPSADGCQIVVNRQCEVCKLTEYCCIREVHDYELKEEKTWTWGSYRHKEMHICLTRQCRRCGKIVNETDVQSMMDAT